MQTTNTKTSKEIRLERRPTYKKIIIGLWCALIAGLLGFAALMTFASYGKIPSFDSLENPQNNFASVVFAAD